MSEKIFELDCVNNSEGVRQLIQNLQQQNRALITDRDRYAAMLNETRNGLQDELNEMRRVKDIEINNLSERLAHIEALRVTHQSLVNEFQNVRENLVAARRRIAELTDEKKALENVYSEYEKAKADRQNYHERLETEKLLNKNLRKQLDLAKEDERRYYEAWQSAALRNAEMLNEVRSLWRTYIPDWTPAAAIRAGDMLNPAWQPLAERLSVMDGILASVAMTSVMSHDTMLGAFPAEDVQ